MPNQYVVVLRSASAARFLRNTQLPVSFNAGGTLVDLIFRTRYVDEGFEATVPRDLWVEARGEADSLEQAVNLFWGAANSLIPIIALCVNAMVDPLTVEVAYDRSPEKQEHEFFQCFHPESGGIPPEGRRVDSEATGAVIQSLGTHSEQARLYRAITQYHLALSRWKLGDEILTVSHLFMGIEALTEVALRQVLRREGKSEAELATSWGVDPRAPETQGRLHTILLAEARRRILFQGDTETHRRAKATSDGIEHGFAEYAELRESAVPARDKTALYLRSAILDLLDMDLERRTMLLRSPFAAPLPLAGFTKYFRATLIGSADKLAATGEAYPFMQWEGRMRAYRLVDDHECAVDVEETVTARKGEGVEFRPESHEVWGEPRAK
jgi:hypothetical protein